ncbi:MAG: hypothetical protein ACUVQH_02615 [Thermogutta sp.]
MAKIGRLVVAACLTLAVAMGIASTAEAVDVPTAAKVFPAKTAVFVSIPDVPGLRSAFLASSSGQMFQDPQLRPFLTDLWNGIIEAAALVEQETGVSLEAILKIPEGELSVGLVSSKDQGWVLLVFLDAGDNLETVQKLIERGREAAKKAGAVIREEDVSALHMTILTPKERSRNEAGGRPQPAVAYALNGSILIGGVAFLGEQDIDVIRDTIARSQEVASSTDSLSGQTKFNQFLSSIRHAKRGKIHILLFADPLEVIRGYAAIETGAAVALTVLPVLGLDGLNSVGGAGSMEISGWDYVRELHVFLDNPRRGVPDVPAFRPINLTPEAFIPAGVLTYATVCLDLPATVSRIAKLYDGFQGDGAFETRIGGRVERFLGVKLTEELLPATTGRMSLVRWLEQPVTVTSIATGLIVEMKDEESAIAVVERIYQTRQANFEKKEFGTRQFYQSTRTRPASLPANARFSVPCLAVLDRYLIVTDSPTLIQEFFATVDDSQRSLEEALEFKLVRGRIKDLAGRDQPSMLVFQRPDEALRVFYEGMLNQPITEAMRMATETNPLLKAFIAARERNTLPPFEVLQRYYAPSGAFLIDDATGLHLIDFGLRKKLP